MKMTHVLACALAGLVCLAPIRVKVEAEPDSLDPTAFPYDLIVRAVDDGVPPSPCPHCGDPINHGNPVSVEPLEEQVPPEVGERRSSIRIQVVGYREVEWSGTEWEVVSGTEQGEW